MQEQRREPRSFWRNWSAKHVQREFAETTDCSSPGRRPEMLRRIFCYVRRLSDAFATHQCGLMACACAYCALLSLVPLLIIGIAAFGFFLHGQQGALDHILAAIKSYAPKNVEFVRGAHELLQHVLLDRKLIGVFGLLGLLYAAHQTFLAMQPAMNLIWNVSETRHWVRQRLIALGATIVTLALLAADLAASTLFTYFESRNIPYLSGHVWAMLVSFGAALVPVGITVLLFAILYQVLPCRVVPWKSAYVGAGVAALLWQVTKVGFGIFLLYAHSYDRLYGSLSGLVILVVWMYYSMAILLLGAEIAADHEATRKGPEVAEERAHSGADLAAAHGNVRPVEPSSPAQRNE